MAKRRRVKQTCSLEERMAEQPLGRNVKPCFGKLALLRWAHICATGCARQACSRRNSLRSSIA